MREWLRRASYIIRRQRRDDELAEEIEFHRAMKERELADAGLAAADVPREARRAMGNDLLARDRARDVWVAPWMQDVGQDVRVAARLFVKEPGFTAVAVLALGLGVGVNNTLFTIYNAFCLKAVPIERPDRVVHVATQTADGRSRGLSFPEFQDLLATRSVAALAAFSDSPASLRDDGRAAERLRRTFISAAGLGLIGEAPLIGRHFAPHDDRPGARPVVILGAGLWRSRYAADPAIVGRSIVVDGVATSVAGVMRDGLGFPHNTEIWQPLAAMPGLAGAARDARALEVIGRLSDGATVSAARAEMEAAGRRWASDHRPTNEGVRVSVVSINERYRQSPTHPAWIAFAVTGLLVVMIACANVANLLLTRAVTRAREMAVRMSLGATRTRLVRQLLVESALLALAGGLLGFVVSLAGVRLMDRAVPAAARSYRLDFSMDAPVFSMLALVCALTVILFGLVPALHVSRARPVEALAEGGRAGLGGPRGRRWTTAFLIVEFALTMILLAGVGDTLAGYRERRRADRVFDPSPLLTMLLSPAPQSYPTAARRTALYDRIGERLSGVGAVTGWALASAPPLGGPPPLGGGQVRAIELQDRPATRERPVEGIRSVAISDRYFAALGVQLLSGRTFTATDGTTGDLHAIVNERFASMYLDGAALGRRVRFARPGANPPPGPWLTVVGVAPSIRQSPRPEPEPVVYVPLRQDPPPTAALIVRAHADPAAITPLLRAEIRALDPDLPLYRVLPMEESMAEASWNARVSATAITTISLVALGLSLVGLYAVTAHAVAQRTPELGVRIAFGASRSRIGWLVLRRAWWQLAMGLAAGVVCALAWSRLFGSSAWFTPLNLAGVMTAVVTVATAACVVPARRAMRVDPVVALRNGA